MPACPILLQVEHAGVDPTLTAMAIDTAVPALYVALNSPSQPSFVYKVNYTSLVSYGVVKLLVRGGAPELALCLDVALETRKLYVLTEVDARPLVCMTVG